jgi:hypothetical protein
MSSWKTLASDTVHGKTKDNYDLRNRRQETELKRLLSTGRHGLGYGWTRRRQVVETNVKI